MKGHEARRGGGGNRQPERAWTVKKATPQIGKEGTREIGVDRTER
jgi:hypothetical protein